MDRIDTKPDVHSSSIHEDIKTRTLYEMIRTWIGQPWDGIQYKRIAEELWDSIDDLNLMEEPYGVSVTLLESCIVDSAEGIDAGLFQAEQAVGNLKKLLENDDFVEGARIIEVYVNTNPVCRISNIDSLLQKNWPSGPQKPQWWTRSVRSYWLSVGVVSFATMIIIYSILIGLGILPPILLVLSIVVGIPMFALSYYFRTVATKRMWRAVFIMLGASGIGLWCLIVPSLYLFAPVIKLIPWWIGMPLLPSAFNAHLHWS